MTNQLFVAYGDNVIIEKLEVIGNTAKGRVIHSNFHDLKHGAIVLYGDSEYNEIYLDKDTKVDVIWRPKIRCILFNKNNNIDVY